MHSVSLHVSAFRLSILVFWKHGMVSQALSTIWSLMAPRMSHDGAECAARVGPGVEMDM